MASPSRPQKLSQFLCEKKPRRLPLLAPSGGSRQRAKMSAMRGKPDVGGQGRYRRSHGVRRLLIYSTQGLYCHHSAIIEADRWPDDTVLRARDRRAVCTKCGVIGADVRPNWSERPQRESLTNEGRINQSRPVARYHSVRLELKYLCRALQ
jgi:hypothetical protein